MALSLLSFYNRRVNGKYAAGNKHTYLVIYGAEVHVRLQGFARDPAR